MLDRRTTLRFALLPLLLTLSATPAGALQTNDYGIFNIVSLRLAQDPIVKGATITVKVSNGIVTLSGRVHSVQARSRATTIAAGVQGVIHVVNVLSVGGT